MVSKQLEDNLGIIMKATQLLLEANLSIVSKKLDYFQKPFCTQVVPDEVVGQPQGPLMYDHEAVGVDSDRLVKVDRITMENQHPLSCSMPTTTVPTETTTYPKLAEGKAGGVSMNEQVMPSPQEQFFGM